MHVHLSHRRKRAGAAPAAALLLLVAGAAPAFGYWGVEPDNSTYESSAYASSEYASPDSVELVATLTPSHGVPGDLINISRSGGFEAGRSYEILFSAAASAETALVISSQVSSGQIVVAIPALSPGLAGLEITDLSDGALLVSTSEAALTVILSTPTPTPWYQKEHEGTPYY